MYNPFKKPLDYLTASDIEAFCKQGVAENLFLDYKEELKGDKLSKNIASFANTKGGIVIVGVREDQATKLPSAWDGIGSVGNLSEQINREIANVVPYPPCRFAIVSHKDSGKAFVVLVIEQGMQAPYFTVHKPIVWVRTGDITTPIEQSNRADLLTLTERAKEAKGKVESQLELASTIFVDRYYRARDDFKKQSRERLLPSVVEPLILGCPIPLAIASIIPNNPAELISHKELFEQRSDYFTRSSSEYNTLALLNMEPVRYGVATQNDAAFKLDQQKVNYVYASKFGLLQARDDLNDLHGQEQQDLLKALRTIKSVLLNAIIFYKQLGYSGALELRVELDSLDKKRPLLCTYETMDFVKTVFVDLYSYDWTIELSTLDFTTEGVQKVLRKLYTDIYLDVGFGAMPTHVEEQINKITIENK